jgi:hypothetical protein
MVQILRIKRIKLRGSLLLALISGEHEPRINPKTKPKKEMLKP